MKNKITENEIEIIEEEDGVIFITYKTEIIDLEIAKKLVNNRINFGGNKDLLVLIDPIKTKITTKEARTFLASNEAFTNIKALAFFSNNAYTNFLLNFIIKVHIKSKEVKTLVKIFNSKEKAIDWLKNQK